MSDEMVKKQLLETLENPQFEVWNSTSVSHLTLSVIGFNGYEVAELAHTLLNRFIVWARENGVPIDESTVTKIDEMVLHLAQGKSKGITDEQLKETIRASLH